MEEINEFEMEVERLYNEWIEKEEQRNISYGEMAYIQNLNDEELKEFYKGLCEVMYGKEN